MRLEVVNVATLPTSGAVARVTAPSRKLTVPVGSPAVDVTVAVNVTDWPINDGLRLEARAVAVAAGFTVNPLVAPLSR